MKTILSIVFFFLFLQFYHAQFYNLEVPKSLKEQQEIARKQKIEQAKKQQEAKQKREQALAIQRKNEERAEREREQARIEAEERAERERLAEIERQKQLQIAQAKAEQERKNKEQYDKQLKWCKNMIEVNGINSCKNDAFCKKQVTEKLKLALTYYDGYEAKNLLIQIQ